MPRNASGTYTLPTGNPVSPGTTIESAWANSTLSDIGTELTNSLSRTGAGGMLAAFRLADGTMAAPGVAFLNETGTGFYRAGSGEMWAAVQGAQIQQYTVNGVMIPTGKTFTAQGASTFSGALSYTSTLTGGTGIVNLGSGQLYKDAAGNVGIGTASPAAKLDVQAGQAELRTLSTTGTNTVRNYQSNTGGQFYQGIDSSTGGNFGTAYAAVLWHSGNYPMVFATNNTERMRLDSAGNLGIGTSSPSYQLQVQGTGQDVAALTDAGNKGGSLYLQATGVGVGSGGAVLFGTTFGNATPFAAIKGLVADGSTNTKGDLAFSTRAAIGDTALTVRMSLTSDGNLGVGTSAPFSSAGRNITLQQDTSTGTVSDNTYLLVQSVNRNGVIGISGSATSTNTLNFLNGASTYASVAGDTANNALFFRSGGTTERMRLDSAGNLGLGVTPSAWGGGKVMQIGAANGAFVFGQNNQSIIGNNAYFDTSWKYGGTGIASLYEQTSTGNHQWSTAPSGTAGAAISFTQAMTLDASGRLLVGFTTAPTGSIGVLFGSGNQVHNSGGGGFANLSLSGGGQAFYTYTGAVGSETYTERARITSAGDLLVGSTGGGLQNSYSTNFTQASGYWTVNHANASPDTRRYFYFGYNGTEIGSITQSGTTAVAYNTSSDYRLKDNPQPLTGSGAFIDALQPKTWDWKADGSRGVGFLAHEAQAVSPRSVVGDKDAVDEDGKPIMQAMEYGSAEFIANIIAELQSLRARVAALES